MKRAGHPISIAIVLASATGHAQSDRELATRQELITQASDLSDHGKHDEALALAKRAAAIKTTPSLRLFLAREQSAVGLLADAYGNGRQCAVEARADTRLNDRDRILAACKDLEESLGKRVGRITMKLPSPLPPNARVTVSGDEINVALVGTPYVVSPGKIEIAVSATGYLPYASTVEVGEGGSAELEVQLVPDSNAQPCPDGQERLHGECVASCANGKVRTTGQGAQCCWPGQSWSSPTSVCTGAPTCPAGLVAQAQDCVPAEAQAAVTPPTGQSNRMLVPLLLGGAGLIIAGVGTGFYIDGDSKYSSLKTQCSTPPGCSTPAYNAAGSMIQRDDGLGIGGWILGGGLIAYGALWYGLSAPKDAAGARLVVDPFTRSAGVVGRF